jgi:hypothetical protein
MLASPFVLPAGPTALAYTDPLTGLANRALFAERVHKAMLFARQSGSVFAVLMLDLDDFRSVNDRHGHEAGDVALQLVGRRFRPAYAKATRWRGSAATNTRSSSRGSATAGRRPWWLSASSTRWPRRWSCAHTTTSRWVPASECCLA